MKELRFQGFSDDVFAVIAPKKLRAEIDCPNRVGEFTLWSELNQCGFDVLGEYGSEGWMLSIGNFKSIDDRRLFHLFRVLTVRGNYEHSPILIVLCPDDVTVTSNQPDDE